MPASSPAGTARSHDVPSGRPTPRSATLACATRDACSSCGASVWHARNTLASTHVAMLDACHRNTRPGCCVREASRGRHDRRRGRLSGGGRSHVECRASGPRRPTSPSVEPARWARSVVRSSERRSDDVACQHAGRARPSGPEVDGVVRDGGRRLSRAGDGRGGARRRFAAGCPCRTRSRWRLSATGSTRPPTQSSAAGPSEALPPDACAPRSDTLSFETWRSLVRDLGLPQSQAIELMQALAAIAARR